MIDGRIIGHFFRPGRWAPSVCATCGLSRESHRHFVNLDAHKFRPAYPTSSTSLCLYCFHTADHPCHQETTMLDVKIVRADPPPTKEPVKYVEIPTKGSSIRVKVVRTLHCGDYLALDYTSASGQHSAGTFALLPVQTLADWEEIDSAIHKLINNPVIWDEAGRDTGERRTRR